MRDGPSYTARGVAVARSLVQRPSTPTGDPDADDRLTAALAEGFADAARRSGDVDQFLAYIRVRTQFFDNAVLDAITAGKPQVVILGAGYDGRALRFRTPGVHFFEVDHPATQRDKRKRLAAVAAPVDHITFVAADFTRSGVEGALQAAGHDQSQPSLFVCEGVLRYLPEHWARALLRTAADLAAPSSWFAISISTRERDAADAAWEDEGERQRQLAAIGEPVLTVPNRAAALQWLDDAGWSETDVEEVASSAPGTRPGRLLVHARR